MFIRYTREVTRHADSIDAVWALLQQHQQEVFHTAKGLPFTYTIRGGELFVDRRQKSITVSTVANALGKISALEEAGIEISGPKKLGFYGASYLYPVLLTLGVIAAPAPGEAEQLHFGETEFTMS